MSAGVPLGTPTPPSGNDVARDNIARCAGDGRERYIAAPARPIVDDYWLAQLPRHGLADQTRNDIGGAAGRDEND
jgi:hypothetical protein